MCFITFILTVDLSSCLNEMRKLSRLLMLPKVNNGIIKHIQLLKLVLAFCFLLCFVSIISFWRSIDCLALTSCVSALLFSSSVGPYQVSLDFDVREMIKELPPRHTLKHCLSFAKKIPHFTMYKIPKDFCSPIIS